MTSQPPEAGLGWFGIARLGLVQSSLGAIVSALIAPFYVWWFKPQFTFPVSMLSCLILLRHHDNIQRLWRRQETKIWTKLKRKKKDPE